MKSRLYLRCLCEGAIMLALAQILGYIRLGRMPYGGSITFAMVPLIFFALRWGVKSGLLVSFVYGIIQLLLDGAYAYTWQSMVLDYLVAYTPIGLAGLFKGMKLGFLPGTFLGVGLRYISLTLSGVYVWAEYMPETFLGFAMTSPWVYSP
ncbi:MAG: energy-coupled thiamine transporter ThiT, partial [Clostridia bacterium]|nr:energy-coupled thiamine transporter ThiT [Clostridia bacterium]